MLSFIVRAYALVLHLYPREFRDEFGDEMRDVFADAIHEATQTSFVAVAWFCLSELRDLTITIWREHRRVRSKAMIENHPRLSWRELLCAAIPFLFYLVYPIVESLRISWGGLVFLLFLGTLFILMTVGLFKGLPRWSLSAFGLLLLIFDYMLFGILGILFLGITGTPPLFLREIFGSGFSFTGLALITLVILFATATIKPLRPFFQRMREDWTLLPFALFGIVPLLTFLSFDEYQGSTPYEIGMGLVLLASVWLYLRNTQLERKLAVLGTGITLAMAIQVIGKWVLIPSQRWVDVLQPHAVEQTIQGEVSNTIYTWFWIMVAVLTPAVLGLLSRPPQPKSATQT